MLPKTKNPQKTRANLAIYCFYVNTYRTIREKESKLRKTAALSQSLQKMFKKKVGFEFIVKTHEKQQ